MKTSGLFLLLLALTGCGTYRHERPVVLSVILADGQTNLVVASERTSVSVLLQKLSGTKITSYVKDGDYSRRVGVGAFDIVGDAAMVQAIGEGVVNGLIKAQTGGVGIPALPK